MEDEDPDLGRTINKLMGMVGIASLVVSGVDLAQSQFSGITLYQVVNENASEFSGYSYDLVLAGLSAYCILGYYLNNRDFNRP